MNATKTFSDLFLWLITSTRALNYPAHTNLCLSPIFLFQYQSIKGSRMCISNIFRTLFIKSHANLRNHTQVDFSKTDKNLIHREPSVYTNLTKVLRHYVSHRLLYKYLQCCVLCYIIYTVFMLMSGSEIGDTS